MLERFGRLVRPILCADGEPMDVTCTCERDLTEAQSEEIRRLQNLAFPKAEEFRVQRWWHSPLSDDEKWFGARLNGQLIGSLRMLFRAIPTPIGPVRIAGLGNVCSHPDHRGCGAASACLKAAAESIAKDVDFGFLFCGDPVLAFYAKHGWQEVGNTFAMLEGGPDGPRISALPHGHAMILPGKRPTSDWPEGEIDLNGSDW